MKAILILIFSVFALQTFAGDGTWVKRTPIRSLVNGQYTLFEPQRFNAEDSRIYNKPRAFVRLNYTRKQQTDLSHNYDWRVTVNFTYPVNGVTTSGSVTVNNESGTRIFEDYVEIPLPVTALGFGVNVTSITGAYGALGAGATNVITASQFTTYIPVDIDFTLELRNERVYNLNTGNTLDDISRITFTPADFKLYWDFQQGAEEYDLEWVFIDKYSPEYAQVVANEPTSPTELVGYQLPFELLEPTSVRVWGNSYQLDKAFPEGRLYFRVRSVSTFADQTNGISDDIRYGKWGYCISSTQLTLCKYDITDALQFESNKTWLYGISYADDGKSVSTLTYFDGSNRGRQNLTYNTSDNVTLVGESKYDKEGRQTVSVIPAPVAGRNLVYQSNFNLAATGNIFDEGEIEQAVIPPLATLSGSAKYFSKNNDFTTDLFRDAIPSAKGYVFSQTIFRNDGTGRIERVGGIGEDFQASGDHAARTWYGSTNVAELKRLFGDNVSDYPEGYRKDMVRDANGQLSVTYYDKRGNTIVTALAGDAPTSLRKLEYAEETITTPLNDNNVKIGNSMISEHTFLNTIPGSVITLDYNLETIAQQLAAQTVELEGYEIPLTEFCANCAYTLRIEVKNQNGATIGTPVQQAIQPGSGCQPTNYSNTGYNVTLPEIGEYRIIKTLTVDEASMIAAFQAQLNAQGTTSYETFLAAYLENVDLTACMTNCEDYCYYKVKQEYLQTHTLAQWNSLTKTELNYLITPCLGIECDLDELTTEEPIAVDATDACETQRQRMMHQFSPGGVYYDDPGSYLWVAVGSSYAGYSLAQYKDAANFTPAMAAALLPIHREYCMLQNGKCEAWMSVQNASFDLNLAIMNASWSPASAILTSPWNYDPALNAFGMGTALQSAVVNYVTNHPLTVPTDACNGTGSATLSSGNLYAYVDFFGNYVAALQQCSGISYTSDELESLKKQLFSGFYMKLKWDFVRANCGCTLENNQYGIFMIPSDQSSLDAITNAAMAAVANAQDCEQVAVNNVNHWMNALPAACVDALGMTGFTTIAYPGTQADAMQLAYTNGTSNPTIAQLFYNYTMASCDVATNPNTFGLFYDPGAGKPGKSWYDAIRSALMVSGCDYASGMLPFETSAPSAPGIAYYNYNPLDLKEAIENLTFRILSCTSCPESLHDQYQSGVTRFMRIKQMTGVTTGMPAGYSGSVRMVKTWQANSSGVVNAKEGYRYYFNMTITNGNCTFEIPINEQSPIGHDGTSWIKGGNFYFRINTPVDPSAGSWVGVIVEDYLDITVNNTPNLNMKWDCLVGTFNGQSVQYLTTAIAADCAGTGTLGFDLGSAYESLQNLSFNQTDDCIQSQIDQATADAQIMYNEMIEDVWSSFYEKMKSCLNVKENLRMTYKLKEYQYTLYYYDLAGNLVQTVPPQGVHPFNQAQIDNCLLPDNTPSFPAHDMETRYVYNGLNALVSSYTPDGGRTDLYLDKLYRVRFSQNAQQVQNAKVSYCNYDELGRVVEAGEFIKGNTDILANRIEDASYPVLGMILDYTHTFYESGYIPPVTALGNTPYPSANAADPTLTAAFGTEGQQNLRNTVGAVMHRQADFSATGVMTAGTEVITVISYSYDAHKNVKKVVTTNNHLAALNVQHKRTDYRYDLISGNVEEVIYQQGALDEYRHRYHYDANNRLVRSYTSHNGDYWELDAKYFYYLHGALARRELGNDQLQGTDYAYNLQGWLKGVNSSTLDRTRDIGKDGNAGSDNQYFGVDAFGFSLGYFTGDYQALKDEAETTPNYSNDYFAGTGTVTALNQNPDASNSSMASLYNGNITHMVTAMRDKYEAKLDILANNYQYDQLQRIREMKVYSAASLQTNNNFTGALLYRGVGGESAFQESYTFDKNGNLRTLKRNGSGKDASNNDIALAMDNFSYYYQSLGGGAYVNNPTTSNRLSYVSDAVPTTTLYTGDIEPGQSGGNYQYNLNGQLISDAQEQIQSIEWTVTGKVKKITYTSAGKTAGKRDVKFIYDPMDRRVAKLVYTNTDNTSIKWTYYSYDAGGNVLASYDRVRAYTSTSNNLNNYTDSYLINDHFVYGAGRLGTELENVILFSEKYTQTSTLSRDVEVAPGWNMVIPPRGVSSPDYTKRVVGDKRYELSNHLGNVLEVVSDLKVRFTDNGTLVYAADVISYSDYSPYGTLLDSRHGNDNTYRYGFQGQERDDEIKGAGNSYNYEYRMHDPRIGRFFAIDPLAGKFPYMTPYQFAGNKPIWSREIEGLESEVDAKNISAGSQTTATSDSYTIGSTNIRSTKYTTVDRTFNVETKMFTYTTTIYTSVWKTNSITGRLISVTRGKSTVSTSSETYWDATGRVFNPFSIQLEGMEQSKWFGELSSERQSEIREKYQQKAADYIANIERFEHRRRQREQLDGTVIAFLPWYQIGVGIQEIQEGNNWGWLRIGLQLIPMSAGVSKLLGPGAKGIIGGIITGAGTSWLGQYGYYRNASDIDYFGVTLSGLAGGMTKRPYLGAGIATIGDALFDLNGKGDFAVGLYSKDPSLVFSDIYWGGTFNFLGTKTKFGLSFTTGVSGGYFPTAISESMKSTK